MMTAAGMAASINAALTAEFGTELDEINDNTDLSLYTRAVYQARYNLAYSQGIVSYIQSAARATGSDVPNGDTHNLNIV